MREPAGAAVPVRATLHDELMRDAGLESDCYAEHARRRQQSRQRLRRALRPVAIAGWLVWLVAQMVDFMGAHVPRGLLWAALAAGVVGAVADWVFRRMTRNESDRRHRGLLWTWKRITRLWRNNA